ncbi:DMT family transporter [Zongyangia hominis]|uniref:EamA family transporter n=1 Tax=Zongyangia hominis TaxID=2763677 RepID=A0A926EC88_9FIRM|nr:DMT family transporter [Zongyangia hominis]MBC8571153.1 EamA family transporter [Zongyangia hominis]
MGQGQATILLVVCAAMWSFAGTWIKLVDFHPIIINSSRCVFAALTLFIYFKIKKDKIAVNKGTILGGLIMASVMTVTVAALSLTTAANAIILQYMSPVYVLIISAIFFHQKVRGKDVLVVIFSILGVTLFFIDKVAAGSLLGNVLGICGGILFGISFLYNNRTKQNPLHIVFWGCVFSALIGIPFYFLYPPHITALGAVAVVMMGSVHLGVPYILYGLAIQRCSALNASVATMIEPILTPIWVFLFVGEAPGKYALAGAILVMLVISLYSISNARAAQKAAQE